MKTHSISELACILLPKFQARNTTSLRNVSGNKQYFIVVTEILTLLKHRHVTYVQTT
jgi:hypothetical protein